MQKILLLLTICFISCQNVQKRNITDSLRKLHGGDYSALSEIKEWINNSDKTEKKNYKVFLVYYIESYHSGECPSIDEQTSSTILENAESKYIDEFERIKRSCEN